MTLWIIVVGFVIGFALAFSIGANDVANSFGTSVGSRVLSLRRACILASIFELLGAVLVGAKVSNTISKGIIDVRMYEEDIVALEIGYLSALIGACIWLFVATLFKLPVSGTHSIVGAVIGFTLVARGSQGVNWIELVRIASSWFISPVMSGFISSAIYFLMQWTIFSLPTHIKQLERGIFLLPFIYAVTFAVNSFSVFYDGPRMLYLHEIPWWGAILISFIGVGGVSALLAWLVIGPRLKRHIMHRRPTLENLAGSKKTTPTGSRLSINNLNNNPTNTNTTVNTYNTESTQLQVNGEALNVFNSSFDGGSRTPRTNYFTPDGEIDSAANKSAVQKLLLDDAALAPSLSHSVSSLFLKEPFTPMESQLSRVPSQEILPAMDKGETHIATTARIEHEDIEYPGIFQLFAFLQILTACFGAFAHGGNDVSNAIGPVIGLWSLHTDGHIVKSREPDLWILALGGVGITVGLWLLGRRVIETVGSELSEISPPSGFCIELGSATTVLVASQVRVPVSTTHCKIGSVVFVGLSRGGLRQIDWRIFRNIILAWVITVPASGLISAGVMYLLNNTPLFDYLIPGGRLGVGNLTATTTSSNWTTTATPTMLQHYLMMNNLTNSNISSSIG